MLSSSSSGRPRGAVFVLSFLTAFLCSELFIASKEEWHKVRGDLLFTTIKPTLNNPAARCLCEKQLSKIIGAFKILEKQGALAPNSLEMACSIPQMSLMSERGYCAL